MSRTRVSPGPQAERWLGKLLLNGSASASCQHAPTLSPRSVRSGPQHSTPRAPPPPPALRVRQHYMACETQMSTSRCTSLAAHRCSSGRSSSLLLPPGHVRKHVEWQRRAAPPASASAELREPKALEAAERLLLGAPGSRQHPSNRCSRVGAPRRSLRPSSSEEVSTCRHPPAATPCPQPAAAAPASTRGDRRGLRPFRETAQVDYVGVGLQRGGASALIRWSW